MDEKIKLLLLELLMERALDSGNKDKLAETLEIREELLESMDQTYIETVVSPAMVTLVDNAINKGGKK